MQAALVAAGIFLSRVLGLVRESLKARYLGATGSIVAVTPPEGPAPSDPLGDALQNFFGATGSSGGAR